METRLPDEKELLFLVSHGDERAFRKLFDHYADRVYSAALAYIKREEDAEEILQDVFLKLWTGRDKLREVDNFEGYVFRMARNAVTSVFRKRKREARWLEEVKARFAEYNFGPEEQASFREAMQILLRAVNQLPPQQKRVFELVKEQDWSLDEAAEKMGLSKGTVKNHLKKAMQAIREFFRANQVSLFWLILFFY